jgi:NADP-dependent 3-hydroxy acid dehydrogenase YdfG
MTGAVVTGAGRGLGRLIAQGLVARGHTVLVTDVDAASATRVAEELGERAFAMRLDVRDSEQVNEAVQAVLERAGSLDVWVNNAGVLLPGPAWEQTVEQRDLMLDVNARGSTHGTVAAIEAMRERGGHIVNVVSLAGISAVAGEAVYAASKHAVIGFSLSTMADLRAAGIKNIDISCVCPDGIWTPMLEKTVDDPETTLSYSGVLLQPEQVADAVGAVLDKPRLVTVLPRWRGVLLRFGDAFPRLGLAAVPLMVARGRAVQRKKAAQQAAARGR